MPQIHPAVINGRYHNNDHDNESVVNVYAGKSAYHSALTSGFVGTEAEWVLSLHGKTLYLHAVDEGYTGTLAEYLISIQGTNGTNGEDGAAGANGTNGTNGEDGAAGANGINGTNGNDGAPGTNGINGTNGTNGINGTVGPQGPQGSAGNDGNDGADSTVVGPAGPQGIQGPQGSAGNDGNDGADSTVVGPEGPQGIQGVQGPADGDSAYTVAVQEGFVGDETAWLASLVGSDGIIGSNGQNGVDGGIGPIGPRGYMGYEGPQGPSNGIVGPRGPAGVVVGLGNLVARLENLETYSPLIVNGNGSVSDITYKNKEEIVFEEQLLNPTITGVGGAVPWTPDAIGGMKLWLDASDLTSVPTTWTDKSGEGNIMTHTGSPTLETDAGSGLKTIHYNDAPDKVAAAARITGIRTVFWVFNRDPGSTMNSILSDTQDAGPFFRDNGVQLWKFNQGLARHESNRAYVNGFRNPTTHGGQTIPHELSVLAVKSNRYTDGFGALGIGETPIDHWFKTGFKGNLGELILFDSYLDDADIAKVEGYLAHKWNLNSDLLLDGISDHPHLTLPPMNEGGVNLANWTKSLGNWDTAQLANGILQGYGMAVSIRQTITTLANEIYEVGITRVDSEEGLTVKLRTSTNVKWLTHNNDITNEVDVPFNTVARFEIIGNDTPTYIELDTVDPLLQITAASLKRKKLAGGVIQELTNNTIKKISGGDSWNAGASSVEFINGQGEGYVQFQMAQSGKDIKVGLTYADLDYGSITPFQIYFTGTVAYAGAYSYYCNYISGDWFRLHHDSVNNQILFKKREADGLYETKHTFPTTTDGSHLYLDTAFKHEGGRINDISMVLGASEGTTQGAIYPWSVGPQGVQGPAGADSTVVGPQGPVGVVTGLADILARITTLEGFSPLDNVGVGAVTDITYRNKQEIIYTDETLLNPTLQTTGTTVSWTPANLTDAFFWLDATDASTILTDDAVNRVSSWNDKSGNGNNFSSGGGPAYNLGVVECQPNTNTRTYSSKNVIDAERTGQHHLRSDFTWGNNPQFTLTMMIGMDSDTTNEHGEKNLFSFMSNNARGEMIYFEAQDFWGWRGTHSNEVFNMPAGVDTPFIYTQEWNFTTGGFVKHYINGTLAFTQTEPTTNISVHNRLALFDHRQMSIADSNPVGFRTNSVKGFIGDLICTLSIDDDARNRTQGYLSSKWDIQLGDTHIYRYSGPTIGAVTINDWTIRDGGLNIDLLELHQQVESTTLGGVSIRQNVSVNVGDVYNILTTREDAETSLTTKIKTSTPVKWLSHLNDINDEADMLDNQVGRFEVLDNTDFYIEVDTVNTDTVVSAVSMNQVVLAGGVIQELSNNTIKKISGGSNWNAGTSSVEVIGGQSEGYVQFQMAQSGKSIKIGLTYDDVDYVNITPFEILFTGTIAGHFNEDNYWTYACSYISGDWFRLRHDSVNNQIIFQKRIADLTYEDKLTFPITTDGRDLHLDTSFNHVGGRINDISMIH